MVRRLPWIALAGLTLLIPASPAPAEAARGSKLFLWKATSATTDVYLLGSIHLGKKEFYPLAKEIESAYDRSHYLVVEADESKYGPGQLQGLVLEHGMYGPTDSLAKHASPETMKAVNALAERLGFPPGSVERMKPWFLSLTLSLLSIQKLGYTPEFGIDRHFTQAAREKKKDILELESMEFQIKLLAGFSEALQLKFLESTIEEAENTKERMDRIVAAWSKGDAASLEEEMLKKPLEKHPSQAELHAKMLDERNVDMAKKIGEYLKSKDVHFVVVGASHLIGEKGIVRLLQKDGVKVEQVEAQ